jgi:hypothetical protein
LGRTWRQRWRRRREGQAEGRAGLRRDPPALAAGKTGRRCKEEDPPSDLDSMVKKIDAKKEKDTANVFLFQERVTTAGESAGGRRRREPARVAGMPDRRSLLSAFSAQRGVVKTPGLQKCFGPEAQGPSAACPGLRQAQGHFVHRVLVAHQ